MDDSLETRVLRAMTVGLDSVLGIRVSLSADEAEVRVALAQLVETGLVQVGEGGDGFVLTPAGAEQAKADSNLTAPPGAGDSGRRKTFVVAAIMSTPLVLLGLMLLNADEPDSKVFGAVLLVGPGLSLLVLGSWAFANRPARLFKHWQR